MASSQDGGVGRHTVPPRTTKRKTTKIKKKKKTELTENQTVWKSDNQQKETFIQTGRRGRHGQLGQRGLMARLQLGDLVS